MIRAMLVLLVSILSSLCHAQQAVFLVRHADREASGADALTPRGQARAEALGTMLKQAGVTLIVHSNTRRTEETALPVMKSGKPIVKVVKTGERHVDEACEAIRTAGDRAVVLYVGHSNTVGPLLRKLGHAREVTLGENDYGDLFLLVPREPAPTLLRLRFGD
jgi:phosphohistidine phosphatase SixA